MTLPQQNQTAQQARTSTWDLDPTHSSVEFGIKHMMFATVRGRFRAFAATLHLGEAEPRRSRLDADIEVASIDTGVADRDTHLRSGDFFDAEAHPKITFRSRSIRPLDDATAEAVGDLTIRGVTQPVTLKVTRDGVGTDPWGHTRASYTAEGTIQREAYGLKWNQLLETGGVLLGNQVKIQIQAQVVQRAG